MTNLGKPFTTSESGGWSKTFMAEPQRIPGVCRRDLLPAHQVVGRRRDEALETGPSKPAPAITAPREGFVRVDSRSWEV